MFAEAAAARFKFAAFVFTVFFALAAAAAVIFLGALAVVAQCFFKLVHILKSFVTVAAKHFVTSDVCYVFGGLARLLRRPLPSSSQ